ncbi:cytochrome-c peroxidase [Sphingobacterium sp. LRF_L2]|uniref:cytochrome-c peroxidase n=1 Tax=Sphingobacterium sp. LRF_L2 TaxID=3369421 RepID=UPI003F613657
MDILALRKLYQKQTTDWPKATIDSGIVFRELGPLPSSPVSVKDLKYRGLIELGKTLFFDPRLSASKQISCSSCHDPDMHWTDGRVRAIGHNHRAGMRNSPSISFAWANEKLFWDGRALSLEEQLKGSLSNPKEMNADLETVAPLLWAIAAYKPLFTDAFGKINPSLDELAYAMATFMRSIRSARSPFDRFLTGDSTALSDEQVLGLHLFRTKARCINCHNGALFTDQDFHNIGFSLYGEDKADLGRYAVTKVTEDVGKFKTPSLRNTTRTGPWLHNGMFQDLRGLLNTYNRGMPRPKRKPSQENDPLFPETSIHLKPLDLTPKEIDALLAFLESISTLPYPVNRPVLPGMD